MSRRLVLFLVEFFFFIFSFLFFCMFAFEIKTFLCFCWVIDCRYRCSSQSFLSFHFNLYYFWVLFLSFVSFFIQFRKTSCFGSDYTRYFRNSLNWDIKKKRNKNLSKTKTLVAAVFDLNVETIDCGRGCFHKDRKIDEQKIMSLRYVIYKVASFWLSKIIIII